jgi:hypothetical protein
MIGTKVHYPEQPKLGLGVIKVVNPYHDGTDLYKNNEHYKVYFSKPGIYMTIFKEELIILNDK